MLSKSAVISWERGYNGGSRQSLEIWYRISNSDDFHWKTIKNIPADLTSYAVYDIEPSQSYLFSMRGRNKMGFGVFSRIFRTDRVTSRVYQHDKSKGEFSRPIYPMRSVVYDSYSGVCERINKRTNMTLQIPQETEWARSWHWHSLPFVRMIIGYNQTYSVNRSLETCISSVIGIAASQRH